MVDSLLTQLEALIKKLTSYRNQQTRFFNRPTDEELALSNACEDRENALLDVILADLQPLLVRLVEQQRKENTDGNSQTCTQLPTTVPQVRVVLPADRQLREAVQAEPSKGCKGCEGIQRLSLVDPPQQTAQEKP